MHLRQPLSLPYIIFLTATTIRNTPLLPAVYALETSDDYYCGLTWPHAATSCPKHCPTGQDSECADALGDNFGCFFFTGCREKIDNGEFVGGDPNDASATGLVGGQDGSSSEATTTQSNNNFCGQSWITAMVSCNAPCPMGTECSGPGESCFAATNCDRPLQRLVADMLVTLLGADSAMDEADGDILGGTLHELLQVAVEEEGVALDGVNLGKQEIASRRELQRRYKSRKLKGWMKGDDDNNMRMTINNVTQRILPSGSSALDVSMIITGDYRPPPYLDLNVIAEDSINRQGEKVVNSLRERGSREGRSFFDRVDGIEAVAQEAVAQRPTREPTPEPTLTPTFAATENPSDVPSTNPTSFPSNSPSRSHEQAITTGSQQDLTLGGSTSYSYGLIFNIRTRSDGGVVLLNGFEFYTESSEYVKFELWTRMGSFKDYKGSYDGWDLIASGSVQGRGIGRYTSIPDELFTPVSIPGGGGDGGTRAFYLTFEAKELVYKIGSGTTSDDAIQDFNEDIEIWEGESVLSYPFPELALYYRFPRRFLGAVRYNRLPCKPFSLYGPVFDLPCPLVPTTAPSLPPPSKSPVTAPPSKAPTTAALVGNPTVSPSISPTVVEQEPTMEPTEPRPTLPPTSAEPTLSPIVPQRANVVSVIRNVPDRDMTEREIEKFLDIMKTFLTRHTQSSMVIDGIDLWHHKLTMADGDDTVDSSTTSQVVSRGTLEKRKGNANTARKNTIPQVTAVEITMILRISITFLPLNLLGNLAAVSIDENQSELLALLNEQSAFYTYFRDMDGIQSHSIDYVTDPPTLRPTTQQQYLDNQELSMDADVTEESEEGVGMMVFVGIAIAVLWCCLTIVSISYLMKRRAEMRGEHDMDDLLRQEKVTMEGGAESLEGGNNKESQSTDGDEEDPSGRSGNEDEVEGNKNLEASTTKGVKPHSMASQSLKDGAMSDSKPRSRQRRKFQGSFTMSGLKSSLSSFGSNSSGKESSNLREVSTSAASKGNRRSSQGGAITGQTRRSPPRRHHSTPMTQSIAASSTRKARNRSSCPDVAGGDAQKAPPRNRHQSMVVASSAVGRRASDITSNQQSVRGGQSRGKPKRHSTQY
ncbi:hypothetical protein ACHAXR_012004 [Thalassiosira sp. AJA248-18]